MPNRYSELVAFGPELCEEARRAGHGVNESYLVVHRVLSEVFSEDLSKIPETNIKRHLSARLQDQLKIRE